MILEAWFFFLVGLEWRVDLGVGLKVWRVRARC